MRDRLIIDGVEVELSDNVGVVLNRAVGEPSDMSAVLAGYSYTIYLKKSAKNVQALGYSSIVNIETDYAHTEHTAIFYREGVPIFNDGIATIEAVTDEIEILVKWGQINQFTVMRDTNMRDLPINDTMRWDPTYFEAQQSNANYRWHDGLTDVPYDAKQGYTFRPVVRVRALLNAIMSGLNYTMPGRYVNFINNLWMLLPTTRGNRAVTNKLRFTLAANYSYPDGGRGLQDGDVVGHATYTGDYDLKVGVGTTRFGRNYYSIYMPKGGVYRINGTVRAPSSNSAFYFYAMRDRAVNADGTITRDLVGPEQNVTANSTIDMDIEVNDGDYLMLEVTPQNESATTTVSVNLTVTYTIQGEKDAEELGYMMDYPIKDNLPDNTCLEFLTSIMGVFGLMVEYYNGTAVFFNADDVIGSKEGAKNISSLIVNRKEDQLQFSRGLTRKNILKYAESDLVPEELGQYTFTADTYNTQDHVVFESIFAASEDNIPLYHWNGESYDYTPDDVPRLLLISGTITTAYINKQYESEVGPYRRVSTGGRPGRRERSTQITLNSYSFTGLTYSSLVFQFWQGYIGVFANRPRILTLQALLTPDFMQNTSFAQAVYIDSNYYMLLAIRDYKSNNIAELELALIDNIQYTELPAEALMADYTVPIMFDMGEFAFYREPEVLVEGIYGKLIRELDDPGSTPDPETSFVAVDLGYGEAVKVPLNLIGGTGYWTLEGAEEDHIETTYNAKINVVDGYLDIDQFRFRADRTTNTVYIELATGEACNIASLGGVSALGLSDTSGSGGAGLTQVVVTGSGTAIERLGLSADGTILTGYKDTRLATYSELSNHINNISYHVSSSDRTFWNNAGNLAHYHANKALLDVIDQNLSTQGNPTFASYVRIGNSRLRWDATNNALAVEFYNGGVMNLYATGGVSALGQSGTSGGAVNWNDIVGKPSWIGSVKPTYSWDEIVNKPNTISSINSSTTGSGNVITNVTASGSTVFVTRGNIIGSSPIVTLTRQADTSNPSPQTGVTERRGYRNLANTNIAAGATVTFTLYDTSSAGSLVTSMVGILSGGADRRLITSAYRDGTYYILRVHNPTTDSINTNGCRVYYFYSQI